MLLDPLLEAVHLQSGTSLDITAMQQDEKHSYMESSKTAPNHFLFLPGSAFAEDIARRVDSLLPMNKFPLVIGILALLRAGQVVNVSF